MRIAILLPDLRGGGVERVRLLLARAFLDAGHDVTFVLLQGGGALIDEVPAGARTVSLGVRRFRGALPPLVRWLRAERPDLLLVAMWPVTGLALLARALARVPTRVIVSEHNDLRHAPAIGRAERQLLKLAGRRIYGSADGVVAVSGGVADSLTELARLPHARIAVIHNPIRTPSEARIPADDPVLAWWRGGRRLIAIGHLKRQKGFDVLIDAVAAVRAGGTDVRLLILGEGREQAALTAQIASLGLTDAVRLAGFRADPFPWLREAELFVLSSRWEGLGNVIIEAMAMGVPIVSTDAPSGPAELLEHGRLGRLVPVEDAAALAAAIREALAGPADQAPLRAHAARFRPAAAAAAYLALLD